MEFNFKDIITIVAFVFLLCIINWQAKTITKLEKTINELKQQKK